MTPQKFIYGWGTSLVLVVLRQRHRIERKPRRRRDHLPYSSAPSRRRRGPRRGRRTPQIRGLLRRRGRRWELLGGRRAAGGGEAGGGHGGGCVRCDAAEVRCASLGPCAVRDEVSRASGQGKSQKEPR